MRALVDRKVCNAVLLGLLGLIAVADIWIVRAHNAAEMTHEIAGVASDVLAAARRPGFRRRNNVHPVDDIDDTRLAIGALGLAFLALGGLPNAEDHDALMRALQSHLGQYLTEAEETLVLGRRLVSQAGGPQQSIVRLAKRLQNLDRTGTLEPLMQVLNAVGLSARGGLSERQKDALSDIARLFRLS